MEGQVQNTVKVSLHAGEQKIFSKHEAPKGKFLAWTQFRFESTHNLSTFIQCVQGFIFEANYHQKAQP